MIAGTLNEAMVNIGMKLVNKANDDDWITSRGMKYVEILGAKFTIENPLAATITLTARNNNKVFSAIERLNYLSGHGANAQVILHYNSRYSPFVTFDGHGYDEGAYGPRLAPQLVRIAEHINRDLATRRATATIYNPNDQARLDDKEANIPCTVLLQFMVRDAKMHLISYMRSNDLYLGTTYDVEQFCFLLQVMANWCDVGLGTYTHIAGSLHLYEGDVERLHETINSPPQAVQKTPPQWDGPLSIAETYEQLDLFWHLESLFRANCYTNASPIDASKLAPVPERLRGVKLCSYLQTMLRWVGKYNDIKRRRIYDGG